LVATHSPESQGHPATSLRITYTLMNLQDVDGGIHLSYVSHDIHSASRPYIEYSIKAFGKPESSSQTASHAGQRIKNLLPNPTSNMTPISTAQSSNVFFEPIRQHNTAIANLHSLHRLPPPTDTTPLNRLLAPLPLLLPPPLHPRHRIRVLLPSFLGFPLAIGRTLRPYPEPSPLIRLPRQRNRIRLSRAGKSLLLAYRSASQTRSLRGVRWALARDQD
jgi:hypothetical protein